MKKISELLSGIGIRSRLILSYGIVLLAATLGTTFTISHYNQKFMRELLEENNAQKLTEIDYELDSLFARINQLFLSFNSQQLYQMFQYDQDMSHFEQIKQQLEYENEIKESINANNLKNAIRGNIFYINQDYYAFVGSGTMQSDFPFDEAIWVRLFQQEGGAKLIYGPLTEDYRTQYNNKEEVIYLMRTWNVPLSSGIRTETIPFILFSIRMEYIQSIFEMNAEDTRGFLVEDASGRVLFTVSLDEEQKQDIIAIVGGDGRKDGKYGTWLNEEWFVAEITSSELGWKIYSAESTKNMFHDMYKVIRNLIFIVLCMGVAALLLAVLFSRRIMMPITLLNQLISTIEEENDTFIEVKNNDELGQIGNRFNQMKRKLQEMSANMYLSKVQEKEAQLSALQSQINPHFLYNTLDNIYCIAQIEEVDSIVYLTENLSKMMRYSMDMKNHEVPLERELEHVCSYTNIINIRFDDSITLDIKVQEEMKDCLLLKLSMQPLVENAWNHGLLPKPGHKGKVSILIYGDGETMAIEVVDDGVGITARRCEELNQALSDVDYEKESSEKGSGVALKNVNNRIKLSDGVDYGISIHPVDKGGCKVIMRMKKRK